MDNFQEAMKRFEKTGLSISPVKRQYQCPDCKDTGFLFRLDEKGNEFMKRCRCYETKKAIERLEHSHISTEFQKKSFENFITEEDKRLNIAKKKAMRYVKKFSKMEHERQNSILFSGQPGAGKTHLGIAICKALLESGVAVLYMSYRTAVTALKQSILNQEEYNRELERYQFARVLYIDDLLKGKLTEADINILYDIINYRYMQGLPLIISTEKDLKGLIDFDEAIGSRLIEMCRGNIVLFKDKDLNYRIK